MRATALLVGVLTIGSVALFDTADGALSKRAGDPTVAGEAAPTEAAATETALVVNADGSPYDPSAGLDTGFESDPFDMADEVIEDYEPADPVDQYETAPDDDIGQVGSIASQAGSPQGMVSGRID